MAKYELPTIQSMYRDTAAVQVNALKRQEYLANMQADNTLSTSIMNMDSLPQDKEKLGEIADQYNGNINTRSERKDYENLGMTIHKDAMDFVKDYSPIKNELAKSNAYTESLKKRLASTGPDRISQQIYNNALRISNDKYKGVANGSKFNGITVSSYVDVDKRIQEKVKDYAIREWSEEIELPADQNYNVFTEDTEPGTEARHYIKTKKGKKYFSPGAVANIVGGVMQEHDVESFINQEASFETYGQGAVTIEGETSRSDSFVSSAISNMQKNINRLKNKEKLTAQEAIDLEYNESTLEQIQTLKGEGVTNNVIHKGLVAKDIQNEYANRANIKYAFNNTTFSRTIKDIKQGEGGGKGKAAVSIQYQVSADGLNHVTLGGVSTKSKEKFVTDNTLALKEISSDNAFATMDMTQDDIINQLYSINTEEEAQAFADLPGNGIGSAATVLSMASQAKAARNNIELVNLQLDNAYSQAGYESRQDFKDQVGGIFDVYEGDQIGSDYNESNGTWTPNSGYRSDAVDTNGNPMTDYNISYQDVISIPPIAELKGDMSTYEFLDKMSNDPAFKAQIQDIVLTNVKGTDPDYAGTAISRGDADANVKSRVSKMVSEFEDMVKNKTKSIEENYITEVKPLGVIATNYGDKTKESQIEMQNFFTEGMTDNLVMYAPDGSQITLRDLKKQEGFTDIGEEPGYEIEKGGGLLNTTRDGEAVIGIPIKLGSNIDNPGLLTGDKNKKGDVVMFYAPVNQIGGIPAITNYTNSVDFRLQDLWSRGESAVIPTFSPPMFEDPSDIDPNTGAPRRTVIFNYADPRAQGKKTSQFTAVQIWDKEKQMYEGYNKQDGLKQIATYISKNDADKYAF